MRIFFSLSINLSIIFSINLVNYSINYRYDDFYFLSSLSDCYLSVVFMKHYFAAIVTLDKQI